MKDRERPKPPPPKNGSVVEQPEKAPIKVCLELKREKQRLGNYGIVFLDAVGSSIEHYINTLHIKDIILYKSNKIDRTMLTIRYIDKSEDKIFCNNVEEARNMIKELMKPRNYFGNN